MPLKLLAGAIMITGNESDGCQVVLLLLCLRMFLPWTKPAVPATWFSINATLTSH